MIYKNDIDKYSDFNKEGNIRVLRLIIPTSIIALISVYTVLYKEENALFIILLTTIVLTITFCITNYLISKKIKSNYKSVEISINDKSIYYKDFEKDIELDLQSIKLIERDKQGHVTLKSTTCKNISFSKYILKYEELLSKLEESHTIKDSKGIFFLVNNIHTIFFLGIMISRFIPYLQFYIFFGLGYILLTTWAIISSFKEIIKNPTLLIMNGVLVYICYIVGNPIFKILTA